MSFYSIYVYNKPDKFSIFFLVVKVESKYLFNAVPYLGKDENRPNHEPFAALTVKKT